MKRKQSNRPLLTEILSLCYHTRQGSQRLLNAYFVNYYFGKFIETKIVNKKRLRTLV